MSGADQCRICGQHVSDLEVTVPAGYLIDRVDTTRYTVVPLHHPGPGCLSNLLTHLGDLGVVPVPSPDTAAVDDPRALADRGTRPLGVVRIGYPTRAVAELLHGPAYLDHRSQQARCSLVHNWATNHHVPRLRNTHGHIIWDLDTIDAAVAARAAKLADGRATLGNRPGGPQRPEQCRGGWRTRTGRQQHEEQT